MLAILAAIAFVISFVLLATKANAGVPWTPEGIAYIGAALLSLHIALEVWPIRRRP